MDAEQFRRAFPPLPPYEQHENPEYDHLLETPRMWTSLFNTLLADYLNGKPAPDSHATSEVLMEYIEWLGESLDTTTRQITKQHQPGESTQPLSEINFHHTNGAVVSLWFQLLHNAPLTEDQLTDRQIHLAAEIAPTVQEFRKLNHTYNVEAEMHRIHKAGYIPEVDALIVGIELMKHHPELVVLPAPSRFESNPRTAQGYGQKSKNSDLVVIDTERRQARGLQVKSRLLTAHGDESLKYDDQYVTMIDSMSELGSTTVERTYINEIGADHLPTGKKIERQRSRFLPGQIALELLAGQPVRNPRIPTASQPYYARSRAIAREIMRGRQPFMNNAVHHLGQRVLHDLYKTSEQKETPDSLVS